MTEPTDDEILEAVKHLGAAMLSPVEVARVVLAKWGTPPAVAGEPVAEPDESFGRPVLLRGAPILKLYTSSRPTKAQAVAVPLTPEQMRQARHIAASQLFDLAVQLCRKEIYTHQFVNEAGNIVDAVARRVEAVHGIKGGQHG